MTRTPRAAVRIRAATESDVDELLALHRRVAGSVGGLARAAGEITRGYVNDFVARSGTDGVGLVALDASGGDDAGARIVGEVHAWRGSLAVFAHVLGDLTIVVDPECQGRGVGRALFTELLRIVRDERPELERVELVTRESNARAIALYESFGFRREGRLERRIRRTDGVLEADVPMGWLRRP